MNRVKVLILFFLIGLIYILGALYINVMEIDAAQYASMSWQMFDSGNYLHLFDRGEPYLDKPPLIFWFGSLFYKLFGINHFVYRLPSLLSTVIGIFSTYKLAQKLYNDKIAIYSALILSTSQAFILFNHDVKTDTLLTNFVIFSIWQFVIFFKDKKSINVYLGFVGISLAMLSKGPIGIMVPILSIGSWLLFSKRIKDLLDLRLIIGFLILVLILSPMVYGLYTQYGKDGVIFYFWTQSFGRITGDSPWKNDADPLFFVHTFLWAFMPWMFLAFGALYNNFVSFIKRKKIDYLCFFGSLLPFLALSTSNFKLPHYINVIFPLVSILSGKYLYDITTNNIKNYAKNIIYVLHYVLNIILCLLMFLLIFYVFPTKNFIYIFICIISLFLSVYFMLNKQVLNKIFFSSITVIIGVNLLLNTYFYPQIFKYQYDSVLFQKIKEYDINNIYFFNTSPSNAFIFYTKSYGNILDDKKLKDLLEKTEQVYIVANKNENLSEYKIINSITLNTFHISMLNINFLNPNTRKSSLSDDNKIYLITKNNDK